MLAEYLKRLGLADEPRAATLSYLRELQAAHMIAVPFENLDVCARRGVTTDTEHSLAKVVTQRRGGWCFEVNGAFGWLLTNLGFATQYISCRVFDDQGWGPPLDHCALLVRLDGQRWFVDVGFGDNCMVPIPIENGRHNGVPRQVEVQLEEKGFVISDRQLDGSWLAQLSCSLVPHPLAAFTPRSEYLQTEPGLPWSEKPFATRALDATGSRITLRPGVLKRREGRDEFVTVEVPKGDWASLLEQHLGLSHDR